MTQPAKFVHDGTSDGLTYGLLYSDKDYDAECQIIRDAFCRYGQGETRSIIDWGCGAGGHAGRLAHSGYLVTGVDCSETMLDTARQTVGQYVTVQHGDVRNHSVGHRADAALLMFAVMGYLPQNSDVDAALRNVRRHLRRDGLLIFDVWYGPAVLTVGPKERVKTVRRGNDVMVRVATGTLASRHHLCNVVYRIWRISGAVVEEIEERHSVRYFFPLELDAFLERAGFELLSLTEFPSLDRPITTTSWNALVVARATGVDG
jgi:SAM-dependent methyltransferase